MKVIHKNNLFRKDKAWVYVVESENELLKLFQLLNQLGFTWNSRDSLEDKDRIDKIKKSYIYPIRISYKTTNKEDKGIRTGDYSGNDKDSSILIPKMF